MLRFLPAGLTSVLEIGCASGNFLASLDAGIYRMGIEPDLEACESARQKLDECLNAGFDETTVRGIEARPSNNRFDCIVFNDVLEHLADPWEALRLAKRLLKPGGTVVASIPNFLFYSNIAHILRTLDFQYESAGIMDRTHLRFFTKKSIIRLFRETGYEISTLEGISQAASLKFKVLNLLLSGAITDLRYMQFAVVARPLADAQPHGAAGD